MNDDIREKLSAYLDGALPDAQRRAVEVELSRSEEMRREFEALRAVSGAVKGLPKAQLPAGFMARLEARRGRESSRPAREYYILPPSYRPLALALSTAVVALVVWDRTQGPEELAAPKVGWDGSAKISVKKAADAPPSFDVSGRLSTMEARGQAAGTDANKEDASTKTGDSVTFGKHLNAPGKPLEVGEEPAPPAPAPLAPLGSEGEGGTFRARNEEERSAINERLYKGLEQEKKRMGIAKIMDKDADEKDMLAGGGREMMTLQASPQAARVSGRAERGVASVRGAAKAKRAAAPVKAIPLKSAEALRTAWAAAGLPGEPPAVAFPHEMAVFLAGPEGCGIAGVQDRKKFIVILYKSSGFDDPSARVRAMPASAKPVVVKLAE